MSREEGHLEEWPVNGDNPGREDLLKEPAFRGFHEAVQKGYELSPGSQLATNLGRQEIPVENLEITEDPETKSFKAKVIEGVGEHKKEILLGTLTVATLIALAEGLHVVKSPNHRKRVYKKIKEIKP